MGVSNKMQGREGREGIERKRGGGWVIGPLAALEKVRTGGGGNRKKGGSCCVFF